MEQCGELRANASMNVYLTQLFEAQRPGGGDMRAPFKVLLKAGLRRRGDAITFKHLDKGKGKLALNPELTGVEHGLNRLHVQDFVPKGTEPYHLALLSHALSLGSEVIRRVKVLAPGEKTLVTVCFDRHPKKGSCEFSFHLQREGQEWWPNLGGIKQPSLIMESSA